MAKPRKTSINKTIALRVTPEMLEALEAFASRSGVSVSVAARNLIAWALPKLTQTDYDMMDAARSNARAEWIEKVGRGWRAAMEEILKIGLE